MALRRHISCVLILSLLLCGLPAGALALEKYGRPLPSMDDPNELDRQSVESLFAGYLLTGVFAKNPSFAARPDNSGLAGMRYMLHLETDLYKQYLTFYTDQNFFSDRTNGWIELSEWDGTYAFTGVVDHFSCRLQYERDAPLDRSGIKQAYADGLITAKLQSAQDMARWRSLFPNQSLTMSLVAERPVPRSRGLRRR